MHANFNYSVKRRVIFVRAWFGIMAQTAKEQRKAPRAHVLRGGVIAFHHHSSTIDCTVRNLTDAGACLRVTSPLGIPDDFDLVLDREKVPRHCRVIWRIANRIGVEFH